MRGRRGRRYAERLVAAPGMAPRLPLLGRSATPPLLDGRAASSKVAAAIPGAALHFVARDSPEADSTFAAPYLSESMRSVARSLAFWTAYSR